jgi:hypothetical protein
LSDTEVIVEACAEWGVRKGLVKIHQAPANRYRHYLTPKGFTEKSPLTARYLSVSFAFYRKAGDSCGDAFKRCQKRGWNRVVLCEVSDLVEIASLRPEDDLTFAMRISCSQGGSRSEAGSRIIRRRYRWR